MTKLTSIFSLLIALSLFSTPTYGQLGKLLKKADEAKAKIMGDDGSLDISGGLKEALQEGVGQAVDQLSAEDGYLASAYKIDLPSDAQRIVKAVKNVPGFGDVEETLIKKMNSAAEIAAKKATPIFVNAITSMKIADARNILMGNNDAATRYLDKSARPALYEEFMPVIQASLDEVDARSYWTSVIQAYNKLPFVKKMNPDLDDHVNNKALDGLFSLIEVKEEAIRGDIDQRTSPLLKEVFAQQD